MSPHTAAPPSITVSTDQGALQLPAGSTVLEALNRLFPDHEPSALQGVATAVNGDFVPRTLRGQTVLQHGDHLLCFTAITGG